MVHGQDKPLLPHMKQKRQKIIFQVSNGTPMSQAQVVTDLPIIKGLGRAGLRRKVPDTQQLLKPKLFSQSPQIQRPALPS